MKVYELLYEMPVVSQFQGIKIEFFYNEYEPEAHFRASYGGDVANIYIATLQVKDGSLPQQILSKVIAWAKQHMNELFHNWRRAQRHERLKKIRGL